MCTGWFVRGQQYGELRVNTDAGMRIFSYAFFAGIAALFWLCPGFPAVGQTDDSSPTGPPTKKMVLFLNSYAPGYPWTDDIEKGVLEHLRFDDARYDLFIEYLDTKKYSPAETFPVFAELFRLKYKKRKPDVIISSDNDAFEFLRTYRGILFADVPVVFCGVNNFDDAMVAGFSQVTGVVETTSYRKTLELALQLFPDTKYVYSIAGSAESSLGPIKELNRVIPFFLDRLEFHLIHDLSFAQFRKEIAAIPSQSIVLNLGLYKDSMGKSITLNDGVKLIKGSTQRPVFTMWSHTLVDCFGGVLTSGVAQGQKAGSMALRILQGEDPSRIPIVKESPNIPTFNYDELLRFHIDHDLLPENGVILNLPSPSLFQQYAVEIVSIVIVFLVLFFLLVALCVVVFLRRKTLQDLQNARNYIANIIDSMPSALISVDRDLHIIQWNRAAERMTGQLAGEVIGQRLDLAFFQFKEHLALLHSALEKRKTRYALQQVLLCKDEVIYVDLIVFPLLDGGEDGAVIRLDNITEKVRMGELEKESRKLHDQLLQAQKIESIGRLAGGVAHDLNNLLVPIIGYAEILGYDGTLPQGMQNAVDEIYKAGTRARDLIRQLLAFSRKQTLEFRKIDLNNVIVDFYKLLCRTIPENIDIKLNLSASSLIILADRGQLEQVVMNMIVNAADAMPDGGKISIQTTLVDGMSGSDTSSKGTNRFWGLLTLQDSGSGMDENVQEKIFEPFFSTKGKLGTGLGLATAYGIIKQHQGNIEVESVLGEGTTFSIFLPLVEGVEDESVSLDPQSYLECGAETILIVEDNAQVLQMAEIILERCGYTILTANSGKSALALIQDLDSPVDLLLTDIVMPEMNGKELYSQVRKLFFDLKVLYMSGYNDNIISHIDGDDFDTPFIQKPFTAFALTQKIRSVLAHHSS